MTALKPRSDRVLLHHISWQQFERLLVDLGDQRSARLAYDNGTLEIMTPLPEHEYYKEVIGDAVKDIADELDIDYECYGSATCRQELKKAGVEADNCFYIQHEAQVRGQLEFNLERDPPPDLALEIDLTSKSLARLPIYARLGVPELWCYDDGSLKIFLLRGAVYQVSDRSLAFPSLPLQELPHLIEQYRSQGRRAIRRAVRQWVQQHSG
ncbi:Uma2 family endonuclease [Sphaerothrix gracilis]|uniref:Uma2 family endonuclease n=1 Tax=Sphaerothrix gracilis TaxID=3151835 RepID=UPI0031FC0D86